MDDQVTPAYIKQVRKKYGMTQQTFARVLGIGEASIIRYEQGSKPSKAMANLIRAASDPKFMADCLRRDGHLLTDQQKEQAESLVYALMRFDEKGEVMDVNEIYEVTLAQEILNEKAALVLADLYHAIERAKQSGDETLVLVLEDVSNRVSAAKHRIVHSDTKTLSDLSEIRGYIEGLESFARFHEAKVA